MDHVKRFLLKHFLHGIISLRLSIRKTGRIFLCPFQADICQSAELNLFYFIQYHGVNSPDVSAADYPNPNHDYLLFSFSSFYDRFIIYCS